MYVVFLDQLGLGSGVLGPVIGFEADRQAELLIDEYADHVVQKLGPAIGDGSTRSWCIESGPTTISSLKVTFDSSGISSTAQRFARVSSRGPIPASVIGCRQSSMARDEVGSSWSVPARILFKPHIVRQNLAAVAAGDINRLPAVGGALKLEIDALRLGPHLHRHDVQRRHSSRRSARACKTCMCSLRSLDSGPDIRRSCLDARSIGDVSDRAAPDRRPSAAGFSARRRFRRLSADATRSIDGACVLPRPDRGYDSADFVVTVGASPGSLARAGAARRGEERPT